MTETSNFIKDRRPCNRQQGEAGERDVSGAFRYTRLWVGEAPGHLAGRPVAVHPNRFEHPPGTFCGFCGETLSRQFHY
jgi:hypothetical protein